MRAARRSSVSVMETMSTDVKAVALRSFDLMRDGTLADFEAWIAADAVNHEEKDEPPESRGGGPRAFHATAVWLRDAFAELDWEIHTVVVEDDLAVVHCTMSGRHVRTFVAYDEHARVAEAFPPTGKRFAVTQTHWIRVADGKLVEHWANRDDMGMAMQLGWAPPSPLYLVKMALAKRRAR
jgi:predicted ester cyclase